jgi:hypothetical protein
VYPSTHVQEVATGDLAPWADDFQTAVKRATPMGMVFKGVPQHHRHIHSAAIAEALIQDPQVGSASQLDHEVATCCKSRPSDTVCACESENP